MCVVVQLMQVPRNREESRMNVGTKPGGTALKENRTAAVSRKQTAVTREPTSWTNMISFLFSGNYVSKCVYKEYVCV